MISVKVTGSLKIYTIHELRRRKSRVVSQQYKKNTNVKVYWNFAIHIVLKSFE